MTLPVVWTPEANEDLQEARAWYDNVGPELGERFAQAVDVTVEALAAHPLQFPLSTGTVAVRECGGFPTEYSSRFRSIGLSQSPASTAGAIRGAGSRGSLCALLGSKMRGSFAALRMTEHFWSEGRKQLWKSRKSPF